jgi:hypothetical protein
MLVIKAILRIHNCNSQQYQSVGCNILPTVLKFLKQKTQLNRPQDCRFKKNKLMSSLIKIVEGFGNNENHHSMIFFKKNSLPNLQPVLFLYSLYFGANFRKHFLALYTYIICQI